MSEKRRKWMPFALLGALACLAALWWGFLRMLDPTPAGPEQWVRYDRRTEMNVVLGDLERRGVVRSAWALGVWRRMAREAPFVDTGTYRLRPGLGAKDLFRALRTPVRQMVRLPEGWWISRTGRILEEKGVCTAEEYAQACADASRYGLEPPLPATGSLEGYLYPDTYDLPPLLGADQVVRRQVATFKEKVLDRLPPQSDVRRLLTIASMVELEAKLDRERPIIAGVIENRLRIGMPLQIDATVLYALGEWKELPPGVVNKVDSPYNTYRRRGLPPGPIGSPAWASIRAALEPASHNDLYYVAMPDGSHLFARTYDEHVRNIAKRQAALRSAR